VAAATTWKGWLTTEPATSEQMVTVRLVELKAQGGCIARLTLLLNVAPVLSHPCTVIR